MKTKRAVVGAILALGVIMFFGIPTASGQDDGEGPAPYQPLFGDLVVEGTTFQVGSEVTFKGDGFAPGAPVQLAVRANDSTEPTTDTDDEADDSGAVQIALMLDDGYAPGTYTATVRGPAVDGATVELSGVMIVGLAPVPTPVPPTPVVAPTPTVQAPIIESPTPTPLPDPGVRNDPPATPDPSAPQPTIPSDGADAEATVDSADAVAGEATGGGADAGDDAAAATDGDTGADPSSEADDGDAVADDADEVAAGGLDTDGSGGGMGRWLAILGAAAVIVAGIIALRRDTARRNHTPRHGA